MYVYGARVSKSVYGVRCTCVSVYDVRCTLVHVFVIVSVNMCLCPCVYVYVRVFSCNGIGRLTKTDDQAIEYRIKLSVGRLRGLRNTSPT